mmetsp:Transcript_16720/g.37681  ORF Transcript_16720/g.37681 Transcript_16720/m.37681 type:complete len:206 (-) Transcript_16720:4871-5488(-)
MLAILCSLAVMLATFSVAFGFQLMRKDAPTNLIRRSMSDGKTNNDLIDIRNRMITEVVDLLGKEAVRVSGEELHEPSQLMLALTHSIVEDMLNGQIEEEKINPTIYVLLHQSNQDEDNSSRVLLLGDLLLSSVDINGTFSLPDVELGNSSLAHSRTCMMSVIRFALRLVVPPVLFQYSPGTPLPDHLRESAAFVHDLIHILLTGK